MDLLLKYISSKIHNTFFLGRLVLFVSQKIYEITCKKLNQKSLGGQRDRSKAPFGSALTNKTIKVLIV